MFSAVPVVAPFVSDHPTDVYPVSGVMSGRVTVHPEVAPLNTLQVSFGPTLETLAPTLVVNVNAFVHVAYRVVLVDTDTGVPASVPLVDPL